MPSVLVTVVLFRTLSELEYILRAPDPTPNAILIFAVFPLHQMADAGRERAHGPWLCGREIIFEEIQHI